MDSRQARFDLFRRRDVDNLLNILKNGTLSDIAEESDDEILQNTSKLLIDDEEIEHQPNQEEPIPQSSRQP
ncbi:unnamed protein product [Pieris brassicae]|uniref:Uncharacterized protein n=1 Tax=Pieris brassicae TaxID=7116 RepID=A0A9P0TKH5_PIEBR|nr:unnamed protein product [Pieris brassicae]